MIQLQTNNTQSLDELVGWVSETDEIIKPMPRSYVYEKALRHRVVHSFLIDAQGRILIQKRQSTKKAWPNLWDMGMAETLKPGEAYVDGLSRGLKEELGVENAAKVFDHGAPYKKTYLWSPYAVCVFVGLFVVLTKDAIVIDPQEVAEVQWVGPLELQDLVEHQADSCTPWLVEDWQLVHDKIQPQE